MGLEEQITQKLKNLESNYFSKVEAAAQIKKDTRTLDRWFKADQGPPATLIAGRRYYNKKQFLQWLIDREQTPVRRAAKGARQ